MYQCINPVNPFNFVQNFLIDEGINIYEDIFKILLKINQLNIDWALLSFNSN